MNIKKEKGLVVMTANEGNIFKSKVDGSLLSNKIYLGLYDDPDNYEEVGEDSLLDLEESTDE